MRQEKETAKEKDVKWKTNKTLTFLFFCCCSQRTHPRCACVRVCVRVCPSRFGSFALSLSFFLSLLFCWSLIFVLSFNCVFFFRFEPLSFSHLFLSFIPVGYSLLGSSLFSPLSSFPSPLAFSSLRFLASFVFPLTQLLPHFLPLPHVFFFGLLRYPPPCSSPFPSSFSPLSFGLSLCVSCALALCFTSLSSHALPIFFFSCVCGLPWE